MRDKWFVPDWPAPAKVRAVSTTRTGGVSTGVYAALNLGAHVGDAAEFVSENRRRLRAELNLYKEPRWLKQMHGAHVATIRHLKNPLSPTAVGERGRVRGSAQATQAGNLEATADAAITQSTDEACVILTADCLPVLFCERTGHTVAAAHAGWRGLAAGVLEATVAAMRTPAEDILVWLGPAIGPLAYEVGDEVRAALMHEQPLAELAFESTGADKWLCDLYLLASQRLRHAGIRHIYGGGFCTYSDRERFFSYRRDGECGRMATLIWIDD
ncbi:MAG TPA: peptidoglycan editing factor PgeF [Gammaproteobacteria bacterium]|nr:peptidoglycan editing factor PgeF [Gammaproteobacteria bacterium]